MTRDKLIMNFKTQKSKKTNQRKISI